MVNLAMSAYLLGIKHTGNDIIISTLLSSPPTMPFLLFVLRTFFLVVMMTCAKKCEISVCNVAFLGSVRMEEGRKEAHVDFFCVT